MCQISDRFFTAARTLTGDGPIKQRLVGAYQEHLESLRDDELPESIRQKFESLRQALNAVEPTNGESRVYAAVRKMSPVDVQRYATSILLMLGELVRVKSSGERIAFVKANRPVVETEPAVPGVIQLRNTGV
ncbi:MAG: hypothetical protein IT486_04280 [Gammaproteobacteria bacterium]|nr:hypothetical protein [Gammaproteobacteria bacterium]